MATKHNRRQRKKLHLGEFIQLGFVVSARLSTPPDDEGVDKLLDDFISDCMEPLGLRFGGGFLDDLRGYVVSAVRGRSATEDQRDKVRKWLSSRPELSASEVGPLTDAWRVLDR